jgi:hypothetical protein
MKEGTKDKKRETKERKQRKLVRKKKNDLVFPEKNIGYYIKIGHYHFHTHPLKFIIHNPITVRPVQVPKSLQITLRYKYQYTKLCFVHDTLTRNVL